MTQEDYDEYQDSYQANEDNADLESVSPSCKKSPGRGNSGYSKVKSKVAGNLKSQQKAKMTRAIVEANQQMKRDMLTGTTDVNGRRFAEAPEQNGWNEES